MLKYTRAGLVLSCALILGTSGCVSPPRNLHASHRLERGIVLVLPGIEGRSGWNRDIALGLDEGGVTSAIEVRDWTTGVPGGYVANLTNLERNRRKAAELADWIRDYRHSHPARPVHLVGHSGGAGMAVLTLEALPVDEPIDAAILLAPALSPEYDLSAALQRTSRGIYSFHSENDVTALKVGTSLFGSIDREFGEAAGRVGFRVPPDCSASVRSLYEARLRQMAWTPRLEEYGADGSHVGWADREFAQRYLAPIIAQNEARRPVEPEAFRKP